MGPQAPSNLHNDYSNISEVPVAPESDRNLPRQTTSGINRGTAQLIAGNDGKPQVLLGPQATFGNGFFVAKPGIDVTATSNPSDFIFNSGQNTFKIVQTGYITMPSVTSLNSASSFGTGFTQSNSIAHNLGYTPAVIAFRQEGDLTSPIFSPLPRTGIWQCTGTGYVQYSYRITVTSDSVYAIAEVFSYSDTGVVIPSNQVKYFLLQESAN